MATRTNRFEMPKRVVKDETTATPRYARFTAEPFEAGYARTLGNSLRRVLLSSIEGLAITSIKIAGANHEFTTVPGVAEDVTDIVINLKQVLLKAFGRPPAFISIHKKGPGVVRAGDFETTSAIQVVNPDLVIATLGENADFDLEAEVANGRGFHPADWNKHDGQEIGVISIDSIFSPVSRVNFLVENTRVGQRVDYEKLTLDIWTDGRVTPDDALRTAAALLRRQFDVFIDYSEEAIDAIQSARSADESREHLRETLAMSVNEIELSVRAANCLNKANITTVGQLVCQDENEMLQYRNFGKKSLNEIKDKLADLGLAFGAPIDAEIIAPYKKAVEAQKALLLAAQEAEEEDDDDDIDDGFKL